MLNKLQIVEQPVILTDLYWTEPPGHRGPVPHAATGQVTAKPHLRTDSRLVSVIGAEAISLFPHKDLLVDAPDRFLD